MRAAAARQSVPWARGRVRLPAPVAGGADWHTPCGRASVDANWTCPFCSLLCDGIALEGGPDALMLNGTDCPRARAGLAACLPRDPDPRAFVDGAAASQEDAIAAAAQRLARWRQPLFGGLGCDLAGARALFRLAAHTGAVCDHADGESLVSALRALQDRGQFFTTLAEVRARGDFILCLGTRAVDNHPEFFRRCGLERSDTPCRSLVFLGTEVPRGLAVTPRTQALPGSGDLFADLQQLAACVAEAPLREADPDLAQLALGLRAASYAVLVWEPASVPRHGALVAEMLHRIVLALNRSTRAASFALGGNDGAATAQQVFTWMSGRPLRTRVDFPAPRHEPVRFAGPRMLMDGAVDGLLWTWSFGPDRLPPATGLPRIVLGPPAMGARLRQRAADRDVFLPVATPGIDAAGHLFRTDGVLVPLSAARDGALPRVDEVAARLLNALKGTP